jgi:hypothetical protein
MVYYNLMARVKALVEELYGKGNYRYMEEEVM